MTNPPVSFPLPPPITPLPSGNWRLTAHYLGPSINNSVTIIFAGFVCDGATIPRFAWRLLNHPLQIPLIAAAILHDAEYSAELYPRHICDRRFLEAMQLLKINWLKRNTIYTAVRSFGWAIWNNHTPVSIMFNRQLTATCRGE